LIIFSHIITSECLNISFSLILDDSINDHSSTPKIKKH
jgi:hypothetical protein